MDTQQERGSAMESGRAERARIAVIGQSHLSCLDEAYRRAVANGEAPHFEMASLQLLRREIPYMVHLDGAWQYNPVIDNEIEELIARSRPRLVVLMLEGQQAIGAGMASPHRPYDFHIPGERFQSAGDGEIVPHDMVLEANARHYTHIGAFLDRVRPFLGERVVALAPPPPIADNRHLQDLIDRESEQFREQLRQAGSETGGLPSPLWRWKTWRLHVTALGLVYGHHGIPLIDPPETALASGRFLDASLIADAFHGNRAYGFLLLRQLEHLVAATSG